MQATSNHTARKPIGSFVARHTAPIAIVLALGGAGSYALAQNAATPVALTPAPAAVSVSTTSPALNIRQIYDHLDTAGYREIREIEWDDGRYEVKARNGQGERVKLYVSGVTGAVEQIKLRR